MTASADAAAERVAAEAARRRTLHRDLVAGHVRARGRSANPHPRTTSHWPDTRVVLKVSERQLEDELIEKRHELKYQYRPGIRDRATLEENFRETFQPGRAQRAGSSR